MPDLEALVFVMAGGGIVCTLMGLLVFYHIFREQKYPADSSNRINKMRLVWFALTREDKFVDLFPWLMNDEWDNLHPEPESEDDEEGERESHGLVRIGEDGSYATGAPKIVVASEFDREQLVAALRYLHDSRDIDTDYEMVNTLTHLYNNDALIVTDPELHAKI